MREGAPLLDRWRAELRRLHGRIGGPRVLIASIPKAGTYALVEVLRRLPGLSFDGSMDGEAIEPQLDRVRAIRRGGVLACHLGPSPALDAALDAADVRVVFISRDPRDVCVSWAHWAARSPSPVHDALVAAHPGLEARMEALVRGFRQVQPDGLVRMIPSIESTFRRRLAWRSHPRCVAVTFEELVGPAGGGDATRQAAAIRRIAAHLGRRLGEQTLRHIGGALNSERSPTLRRGRVAAWRDEMPSTVQALFDREAAALFAELGYEPAGPSD